MSIGGGGGRCFGALVVGGVNSAPGVGGGGLLGFGYMRGCRGVGDYLGVCTIHGVGGRWAKERCLHTAYLRKCCFGHYSIC